MNELAIETQSLHKHFGEIRAVDDLDMHVPRGSIYGFLGRNGAGKTTTIRMLAGLARSTSGELDVLDLDPQTDRVRLLERTGFVIDKALFPSMTGHELAHFNRGFFSCWSDALVDKYTNLLEIPMDKLFRKLSTGNQTKLCMLLALSQGAELLILDEPTAGLDPIVTDQLLHVLVDDFAKEERTLFLSSHHLSEVERVCDWVGIIDRGKLLLEARLDDVRANFRRVRAVGENLEFAAHVDVLSTKTEGDTTEYVVKSKSDGFAAHLRSQGATVLDVLPMNLREVFLEVVRKGEANVHVEILA
jgi:ABC-2 type transport system ATP-binding protein